MQPLQPFWNTLIFLTTEPDLPFFEYCRKKSIGNPATETSPLKNYDYDYNIVSSPGIVINKANREYDPIID